MNLRTPLLNSCGTALSLHGADPTVRNTMGASAKGRDLAVRSGEYGGAA